MVEVNRDTTEGRDTIALFAVEHRTGIMVRSPREGNWAYLFENQAEYAQFLKRQDSVKRGFPVWRECCHKNTS